LKGGMIYNGSGEYVFPDRLRLLCRDPSTERSVTLRFLSQSPSQYEGGIL
jgi:hypothetical protein